MKKLLLPSVLGATMLVAGCCDCKPKKDTLDKQTQSSSSQHKNANMATAAGIGAITLADFDWDTKAQDKSSIDLGSSPYFALADSMVLIPSNDSSATDSVSKIISDKNLNIFDGKNVSSNKGVLSYLNIGADKGANFDKAKFDASVSEYMQSIGAHEFYNDSVPAEVAKQIGELDGISHEDYMAGPFIDRNLRQFALNHDNGQLFYQVMSDDEHGEIGVFEVEGFKAVDFAPIAAPTESENKQNTEEETNKEGTKEEDTKAKQAEKQDDKAQADTADTANQVESQPNAGEMKTQLDKGDKVILNINFDSAKATIRKDNRQIIDQIYALLKDNPELKLSIEGHTDSSGEAKMNQKLSVARAKEVKAELEKKGIEPARLKAAGFGEDKPIASNDDETGRAKNRRVELVKF